MRWLLGNISNVKSYSSVYRIKTLSLHNLNPETFESFWYLVALHVFTLLVKAGLDIVKILWFSGESHFDLYEDSTNTTVLLGQGKSILPLSKAITW